MTASARIYILMGVSGCGKSTLGRALATKLALPFYEGDDFHSAANITKMQKGRALTDQDRKSWLLALRQQIERHLSDGSAAVMSCSALKRIYRDQLGREESITYIYLNTEPATLKARLEQRPNHFMPPTLLASQVSALEAPHADEQALYIDASKSTAEQLATIENFFQGPALSPAENE